MTLAAAESVTYTYPRSLEPALADVSVHVRPREFCLLSGPSGGGKSTLLRLFNGLIPQFHGGVISGRVNVAGFDAIRTSTRQLATVAGMVFQSPEAQAVAETVVDEVAFAMEQRGTTRAEMLRRMDLVLAEMGIGHLRHRRLATLSGGERQRVAVASVLALEPAMLLLDEPTSQLDEFGAAALLRMVVELQATRGIAVLVAEHRLERILPSATRVINVVAGRAMSLAPIDALSALDDVPPAAGLSRLLGLAPRLTLEETRAALPRGLAARPRSDATPGDVLLAVDGLAVDLGGQRVLRDISMALREGEIVALIGQNGSGKSTFFRALTGLARAGAGSVAFPAAGRDQPRSTREITGRAGLVPQDPSIALFRESVRDELAETLALRNGHRPSASRVAGTLEAWNIAEFASRNPRDISVGQQQRVAVAAMLAHEPRIWLLDEPTRGADRAARLQLAGRLRRHASCGGAAIIATHDIESAAQFATRVITLEAGVVLSDLPAREAFAANGPHPTQVARLVPGAVALDEVVFDVAI
ncbi:ATP-binding cassette domain-containing protein [Candidatus Amarobacter glycogenicus]|uniref:ABC transporter ATP-binding protein n=1 Tax=Candidatus Amarobacter glycogenicus TaxID=3140699 RepID=UPI003135A415|nr:ATP-binding cassette domain-containing protein [Dehalococcoidia bacterium]